MQILLIEDDLVAARGVSLMSRPVAQWSIMLTPVRKVWSWPATMTTTSWCWI